VDGMVNVEMVVPLTNTAGGRFAVKVSGGGSHHRPLTDPKRER